MMIAFLLLQTDMTYKTKNLCKYSEHHNCQGGCQKHSGSGDGLTVHHVHLRQNNYNDAAKVFLESPKNYNVASMTNIWHAPSSSYRLYSYIAIYIYRYIQIYRYSYIDIAIQLYRYRYIAIQIYLSDQRKSHGSPEAPVGHDELLVPADGVDVLPHQVHHRGQGEDGDEPWWVCQPFKTKARFTSQPGKGGESSRQSLYSSHGSQRRPSLNIIPVINPEYHPCILTLNINPPYYPCILKLYINNIQG